MKSVIQGDNYIEIKDPQHPEKNIKVELNPITIDQDNDVAILLIPANEVKRFKDETGTMLPAIPASQLSSVKAA